MDRGRGGFRGRGGTRGDGGRGGGRGGYQGNRQGGGESQGDRKPREAILDLGKYLDKAITVKFTGGREGSLCQMFIYEGFLD